MLSSMSIIFTLSIRSALKFVGETVVVNRKYRFGVLEQRIILVRSFQVQGIKLVIQSLQ